MKKTILKAVILILLLVAMICISLFASFNDHSKVVTITDKERIYEKQGDTGKSYYLVFAKDENGNVVVFENTDTIWRAKWNSSDIQAALEIGKTYEVELIGFRVKFLSMYENVIDYTEVQP